MWIFDKLFNRKIEGKSSLDDLPEQVAGKADKSYVDESFVKISSPNYRNDATQVYGKDQTDKQYMFTIAQGSAEGNTIVRRKGNGAIIGKMTDDTTEDELATQHYVDAHSGGGTQLYRHRFTQITLEDYSTAATYFLNIDIIDQNSTPYHLDENMINRLLNLPDAISVVARVNEDGGDSTSIGGAIDTYFSNSEARIFYRIYLLNNLLAFAVWDGGALFTDTVTPL